MTVLQENQLNNVLETGSTWKVGSGGALDVVCTRVVLVHESLVVFNNVVVMHPIMAGHYCVFVSVSVCLNVCELCFFS